MPSERPPLAARVDRGRCALTGQCATLAPELFWFEGDELAYVAAPAEERREEVERAVEQCPTRAISIDG
jgi:ferredoxin